MHFMGKYLMESFLLDIKYVKLPNVLGANKKDVSKILKGFKVLYSGNGDKVIYQEPEADTYVKEGSIVKIMLN